MQTDSSALLGLPVVESAVLLRHQAYFDGVHQRIICGNVDSFLLRLIAMVEREIGMKFIRSLGQEADRRYGWDDT